MILSSFSSFFYSDTRPLLRFSADTVPIRGVAWAPNDRFVVVDLKLSLFIFTNHCAHRKRVEKKKKNWIKIEFFKKGSVISVEILLLILLLSSQ